MRVVKLGGSLVDWEGLPECLASMARLGVTIVPGGGPFAEQVRMAQRRWRFDDGTAHTMAILGMCQFGLMLASIESRLRLAATMEELRVYLSKGFSAVWLPRVEDLESTIVPASWAVTSDSLAAWLATQLGATDLILLKSVKCLEGEVTLRQVVASGIVDQAFGGFAGGASFSTWICYREDYVALTGEGQKERSLLLRVVC